LINRRVLYTDAGELCAPWRLVVFSLASIVALLVSIAVLGPILAAMYAAVGLRGVNVEYWVECIGMIAGTAFALRYVDKRPWRDVWLDRAAARPSLVAIGFALGALAIAVPTILLIGGHWLREIAGGPGSWLGAALRVTMMLVPAALLEELTSRGYILSVLREWWGWPWAIAATSLGFGLLHLGNPDVTATSTALVTLAGVFLASVVYATRSLYAAWAAHFAWNWTMAVLFHTAVSGFPLEAPGYRYVDAGPDWATGGAWGPEGGIPAGLGMIAGVGIAYALARRTRSSPREHS
jgi:membrane protease YdiL (CAAX protease family)